jgi:hypothetical protein
MTDDLPDEARLIELLMLWWRHESQWSPVQGYPVECPSTAGYRASRQYDDANGSFDTDARGRIARNIGAIVDAMQEPHRTALYTLARNRSTGVQVWKSSRLPADQTERARIVSQALEMLGMMV